MTIINLDNLLHRRIIDNCKALYEDGHFPHAALESMKQVELALKEKAGIGQKLFGARLVNQLFGSGKGIKLTIPLGDELQKHAKKLFAGAFLMTNRKYQVYSLSFLPKFFLEKLLMECLRNWLKRVSLIGNIKQSLTWVSLNTIANGEIIVPRESLQIGMRLDGLN